MAEYKMLNDVKEAFKKLMTLNTISDDKEEMEFLIEACARYVSSHYSVEEIKEKTGTIDDLMKLFKEYLEHLQYHL